MEAQYTSGQLNQDAYLKQVAKTNQKYQKDYEFLSSRKYNKQVQRELVNKKEIVSLHEKQEQLVQKVAEIDIKMKKADQVKEIRRAWSDEQILENLTNRSPKFTRNDLIRDIAKYRGLGVDEAPRECRRLWILAVIGDLKYGKRKQGKEAHREAIFG
ncbi:hypothetical protein L0Z16_08280 [Burkholderia multivorans]|uniref:hypothetical protein n=1 Tax=Burkholderia multivorans TaxID=87883 RepID=UPI0020193335|nr:hypothetical protein [Burkholderia multivorans]UQP42208.1 hypothetical protein L0Z16_08280 [Burkholderia multivorans]